MDSRSITRLISPTTFAHQRPIYASFLLIFGLLVPALLRMEYFPLPIILLLTVGNGVRKEIKRRKQPPHKTKSSFEPGQFIRNGELTGELRLLEPPYTPLLEIFTADKLISAQTKGAFMGPRVADFFTEYFDYLLLIVKLKKKLLKTSAVDFINEQARSQEFNLSHIEPHLHYVLKALYENKNYKLTLEDLYALMFLCDKAKGLGRTSNGCTTSVVYRKAEDGRMLTYHIRNVDWFPEGVFQNFLINMLEPTEHFGKDPTKPQSLYISTNEPEFHDVTVINNNGLIVSYNEVGGKTENPENKKPGAFPALQLTKLIAANCSTIAEVKEYLRTHQPASPCNLIITAKDGSIGIECLPRDAKDGEEIIRFRYYSLPPSDDAKSSNDPICMTNHTSRPDGTPDTRTAPIEADGIHGSVDRYDRTQEAITEQLSPEEIAKASSTDDTLQTMIVECDYTNKKIRLKTTTANKYSASAPREGKSADDPFTIIQLDELFEEFHKKVAKSMRPEEKKSEEEKKSGNVDIALLAVMRKSHAIGKQHPKLSKALSNLYSGLLQESVKHPQQSTTIISIAEETILTVDAILTNDINALEKLASYQKLLNSMPRSTLQFHAYHLIEVLSWIGIPAMVGAGINNFIEHGSSFNSLPFDFVANITETITSWGTIAGAGLGALATAYWSASRPPLTIFSNSLITALKKEAADSKKSSEESALLPPNAVPSSGPYTV